MKMLKVSGYCYPEKISSTHLSEDLTQAYIAAGFTIEQFCPTPTRGITAAERERYKKIKYEELHDGHVKIHRFAMFGEGKNPVLRAVRYTLVQLVQYFKYCGAKDVDVIMAGSTPPTQGVLSALIKKRLSKKYKRDVPFVYNLQDLFPESLSGTGLAKKGSFLYKLGEKIAAYTYKNADRIIVISKDFKRILLEKGVPEEKITVIYNWVDEQTVRNIPREENALYDEYGLDRSKFYAAYSGNIGHTQNWELLLDVAETLRDIDKVGFIVVGNGAHKEQLEAAIAERGLTNITLIPFQPYERISEVFSLGDVGLLISKSGVGSNSVPSKTWSYLSAERPVLASFDLDSELCELIEDNRFGVCVSPDDKDGFIEALLTLGSKTAARQKIGENGRAYLLANLTKETCTAQYVDVLRSLT